MNISNDPMRDEATFLSPTSQIIYLVMAGEYSDRHVIAVCSTREKAEAVVKAETTQYETPDIVPWEMDETPTLPPGYKAFWVRMDHEGNTSRVMETNSYAAELPPRENSSSFRCFEVKATDVAHAIKVANEKRIQMIARGDWAP